MKVFLVVCLMSITFLSQGWGGKHYLVKTKEKGKYAKPEAGHDYNDYQNDDDDVHYNENDINAVDTDTYDDETYDDDTNDDDTYDDDPNEEEFDVESFIDDNLDDEAAKDKLNNMDGEQRQEIYEKIKEAASARGEGENEDYNNNLVAIRMLLRSYQMVLKIIERLLEKVDKGTLSKYRVTRCERKCRSQCTGYTYSRSSKSRKSRRGRRGKSRQRRSSSRKTKSFRECKESCRSECRGF